MITSMMGRMADAEKLSIPQLQQAIKNGTIPAYVGVPLLQDKVKQYQKAMAMQQAQQGQGQNQVPIAAQVMQDADQYRGIDKLSTNLPTEDDDNNNDDEYANGGIIAFSGKDNDQVVDSNSDTNSVIPFVGLRRNPNSLGLNNRIPEFLMTHGDSSASAPPASAPRIVSAPPVSTTGSASGVEVVEPPVRSGIDNLVAQPPTRLPDTSATPATVERSMYGNMPLMSPEAKEAFSQYAGMYKDMRGDNKKAREEAKYMALLQAGFGMAGGTSPNALANINQGVQPALAQYSAAIKDIRKDDREAVKSLIELGLTKEKFMQEVQKMGIDVYKANKVFEAAQVRANATIAAANASADGKSLTKTQTLYTSEGNALTTVAKTTGKNIFESPDFLRHQNTLASVPKLPNSPSNQAVLKEAQDKINAAKETYANTMRPYVNRFKSAHAALHDDGGVNFNEDQYLYPKGKPATPRVQFGSL